MINMDLGIIGIFLDRMVVKYLTGLPETSGMTVPTGVSQPKTTECNYYSVVSAFICCIYADTKYLEGHRYDSQEVACE